MENITMITTASQAALVPSARFFGDARTSDPRPGGPPV